jgi:hypothetical protein
MASFFQPSGLQDPVLDECDTSKFAVYCNKLLTSQERNQIWYQKILLWGSMGCILFPVAVWLWANGPALLQNLTRKLVRKTKSVPNRIRRLRRMR